MFAEAGGIGIERERGGERGGERGISNGFSKFRYVVGLVVAPTFLHGFWLPQACLFPCFLAYRVFLR